MTMAVFDVTDRSASTFFGANGGDRVLGQGHGSRPRAAPYALEERTGYLVGQRKDHVGEIIPLGAADAGSSEEIIGASPSLRALMDRVAKVAPTDSTVLIGGETGTGKELIARAIHRRSHRSARPMVSVNCGAIAAPLITAELFGHERGAFTGAFQRRLGRFELAAGGTLFLDEVGELPIETQITLLRALQEREFERVGGTQTIRADFRIVAATNRDLEAAIAAGTFRSDLFYRLSVFPIELPPLRERREDVRALLGHFVARAARRAGKTVEGVSRATLDVLEAYPWPGNVRELENLVERSVILLESRLFTVDESWLSCRAARSGDGRAVAASAPHAVDAVIGRRPVASSWTDPRKLEEIEREAVLRALQATGWVIGGRSGAAHLLGLKRTTLQSLMQRLGIARAAASTASRGAAIDDRTPAPGAPS
ncbi:sigma 54-interacting transcriptional regulator [Candidatus Binatia bacterium]|nr:sigma 54-interacting transcriptional regulator [Candidatus Binatia bacterium]